MALNRAYTGFQQMAAPNILFAKKEVSHSLISKGIEFISRKKSKITKERLKAFDSMAAMNELILLRNTQLDSCRVRMKSGLLLRNFLTRISYHFRKPAPLWMSAVRLKPFQLKKSAGMPALLCTGPGTVKNCTGRLDRSTTPAR